MRTLLIFLALLTAGCGGPQTLYLIERPLPAETMRVPTRTIEVRAVVLPAYASASDIAIQGDDGALRTVRGAVWAEDPIVAVTETIARNLDLTTSARVAAEPWPLGEAPDHRLEVRIERMVARADGQFELTGQYALATAFGEGREVLERFVIVTPLRGDDPSAVAAATRTALGELSRTIARRLAGRPVG
jgi:uncharacterized protein